ncbi:MAG: hypothetical protein U0165_18965 [Polyangiaceae bacterium]
MHELVPHQSHPYREPTVRKSIPPEWRLSPERRPRSMRWSWIALGLATHAALRWWFGPLFATAPIGLYLVLLTLTFAPLLLAEVLLLRGRS